MTLDELTARIANASDTMRKVVEAQLTVRPTTRGWEAVAFHPRAGIPIVCTAGHGLSGYQDAIDEAHSRWAAAHRISDLVHALKETNHVA